MEIILFIILVAILLSLPFLMGNAAAFFFKYLIKNGKFLRILKYFIFAGVFILEFLMIQTYMRRAIRGRIRAAAEYEPYNSSDRVERLNNLNKEGKIRNEIYNQTLNNMKAE
jgi:hypothetical protein